MNELVFLLADDNVKAFQIKTGQRRTAVKGFFLEKESLKRNYFFFDIQRCIKQIKRTNLLEGGRYFTDEETLLNCELLKVF